MTNELVKPITCHRCSGKGNIGGPRVHAGIPGGCFKCDATGQVEGDKAALAAKKALVEARTALGKAAFAAGHDAHVGLSRLEAEAPERCAKAVASFAAGRTDVVEALAAYGRGA